MEAKKASDKQLRWIQHWLEENGTDLHEYTTTPLDKLNMWDAGKIIGEAKKEIADKGFKSVEEYIKQVKLTRDPVREPTKPLFEKINRLDNPIVDLDSLTAEEYQFFCSAMKRDSLIALQFLVTIKKLVIKWNA